MQSVVCHVVAKHSCAVRVQWHSKGLHRNGKVWQGTARAQISAQCKGKVWRRVVQLAHGKDETDGDEYRYCNDMQGMGKAWHR